MNARIVLLTRAGCGSCARVHAQITPVAAEFGETVGLVDVDTDAELRAEYGDRLPVVLLDGEEFACWEVDDADLRAGLSR